MKPFVIDRHGRLFFPSNFLPELDFAAIGTLERLDAVIARDFEAKAPTGSDILERVESGAYKRRHSLMRDIALNLVWVNRYATAMYDKRPTRWRDVPRRRDDVFLPAHAPWEDGARKVAAVGAAYPALPAGADPEAEDRVFGLLFDVYSNRRWHATEIEALKPTVAEMLATPERLTLVLSDWDPDFPRFGFEAIRDCREQTAELEALHRLAMVLHDQDPWDRAATSLKPVGEIGDDEFVVLLVPRNADVRDFVRRAKAGVPARPRPAAPERAREPVRPYPPVRVRERFAILPRIEALAAVKGEHTCSNDDLIRNGAYSWSPMTADDIARKTGIEARRYTERGLDEISLEACEAALAASGRTPEEIGAVVFCSCTTAKLIPSVASWLSGQLGMFQTHASFDLIAACAGFPYGIAEATRLLQEVERPVLVVCAEKFSDKIGQVRTSRMIFGDGAAAIVVGPAPEGDPGDIDIVQSYASGPASEVNSIIWPNPDFDGAITVYGPEVRSLAGRYLVQMIGELRELPHPAGNGDCMLDAIDLVVPHQANRTMVVELAERAGVPSDHLYFDIQEVGNVSAASIPIAISDAVAERVIDRPMRIFAPGFGAGAVGGYAVLRIDPAVVVPEPDARPASAEGDGGPADETPAGSSPSDMLAAFGD